MLYNEHRRKNELYLETIAQYTAISKYHFHRLFHSNVGMTLTSYIRRRRLSNAASELITTERRILEIALDYQFESQEAFTRAFKKLFHMTPGQYQCNGECMNHTTSTCGFLLLLQCDCTIYRILL
ncbi:MULTISPECIES: helix-turn-helix transcriptional regulator [unclassified Paenibacillus]|nr:AraC-like DNA-binding protein [Paenibacillus sp. PvP091]MBP1171876.1 AraC-like DNA-binding protein [Paenibacillus sp. PvR098]MBP2438257.1 AraC-like DNA-binding protein [Paenibacillus sp. PvP052]